MNTQAKKVCIRLRAIHTVGQMQTQGSCDSPSKEKAYITHTQTGMQYSMSYFMNLQATICKGTIALPPYLPLILGNM